MPKAKAPTRADTFTQSLANVERQLKQIRVTAYRKRLPYFVARANVALDELRTARKEHTRKAKRILAEVTRIDRTLTSTAQMSRFMARSAARSKPSINAKRQRAKQQ